MITNVVEKRPPSGAFGSARAIADFASSQIKDPAATRGFLLPRLRRFNEEETEK